MRISWILSAYVGCLVCLAATTARSEFLISSAIIEFTQDGPKQQDIELVSRGQESDYIVTEVSEILHPGSANETRKVIDNPSDGWLLVTPDKTVLPGGSRKLLRFVLLKPLDNEEHIYRVAVKPVVKDVKNPSTVGLKILVGYEALVILRPTTMTPRYEAHREGKRMTLVNHGNTNVILQNGKQCEDTAKCPTPPVLRAYAGQTVTVELPLAQKVTYAVWDGLTAQERDF